MNERLFAKFLDNAHRRLILISALFGIAVLILLPLADRYFAQLKKREHLERLLNESEEVAISLDEFRVRVNAVMEELKSAEAKTVGPSELNAFRGTIVRIARDSRCQVRRIDVGGVNVRPWKTDETSSLVSAENVGIGKGGDFNLTSQTLSLQVTGELSNVKLLLGKLRDQGVLIHTKSFALRPYGTLRDEAILDMELVLYSLQRAKAPAA